jgi:chromosome segregation ATPase
MAGTAGAWVGKSRLDTVVAALFGTADEAFDFIDTRLDRVNQRLDRSRQRVGGLSSLAERLKTAEADLGAEFEPLLQTLDGVYRELQSAEHWLDSSEAVARGVNRVSEAMVSQAAASRGEESEGHAPAGMTAKRVAEFSADVADALARLQVMRQELMDLRDKKALRREFAGAILTRVAELDARLANVSARIDAFNAQVATARASCVDLGRSVHWWITFATLMLTFFLLWFAASQIGMMQYGWRLVRCSAKTTA